MMRLCLMARGVCVGVAVIALGLLEVRPAAQVATVDVSDLAYLWPAPAKPEDVRELIDAAEQLDGGQSSLWPREAFELTLRTAQSTIVQTSAGTTEGIRFDDVLDFQRPETWKVVAFRADPSAPGTHESLIAKFGSTPQIRLVLQPVTVKDGVVTVHDVTAHLAFSFIANVNPQNRIVNPNKDEFSAIVADLVALKGVANRAGVTTAVPLGVHPGLARRVPGLAEEVLAFLKRHLAKGRLTEMAFMGIDKPEPWIFFALVRRSDGAFVQPGPAQMLTFRGGTHVMPIPRNSNVDGTVGVSTAPLFENGVVSLADTAAAAGAVRRVQADIPDIVANPRLSTVRNTDCVSCHTESTRRTLLRLEAVDTTITFARPPDISGVDPRVVPRTQWNVRNFGWFQSGGTISPTVTMRTANEAAEAAAFVNSQYLSGVTTLTQARIEPTRPGRQESDSARSVAQALTLVMDIKSPQDFQMLKALVEGIQRLPPDQNPIDRALTKLSMVHFARFVFLSDNQFAVITTYDGSFEEYIDAFVNAIGPVFDQLLSHMSAAPPLPVAEHPREFLDYVRNNDRRAIEPFYSAYPQLKVLDILTLKKEHERR
jgi:hypothetical protein